MARRFRLGKRGPQGLPGVNAVPADEAVAEYISTIGTSATKTALASTIGASLVGLQTQIDGYTGLGTFQGNWSATTFAAKDIVLYSDVLYIATTAATASDVPGVASLWKALPTTVDALARSQSATVPAIVASLVQRINYATNPGPNVVGGWISFDASLYSAAVRDTTTVRRAGSTSVRLERTATTPSAIIARWDRVGQSVTSPAGNIPVTALSTIKVSAWVRVTTAAQARLQLDYTTAAAVAVGATTSGSLTDVAANTWTLITHTMQVPATAERLQLRILAQTTDGTNAVTGTQAWAQDVWIEDTANLTGNYFDGSMGTVGTGQDAEVYSWSGTAGASASMAAANPTYQSKVVETIADALDAPKETLAVQVNRAPNPGPTKLGGWISADATLYGSAVRDTSTVARVGSTSVRLTRTSASASIFIASFDRIGQDTTTPAANIPVTEGDTYYISAKMRCGVAAQGQLKFSFVNDVGGSVSSTTQQLVPMPANTWVTVSAPCTVPAGAVKLQLGALVRTVSGNAVVGTQAWVQDVMVGDGPYFDGSMAASGDTTYAWAGDTGESESRATRPLRNATRDTSDPLYLTLASETALQERVRLSKGGWIGTSGKGAVALRFDHWNNAFFSTLWPLLVARGLPAGLCMYSAQLDATSPWYDADSNAYTYSQISDEVINHGLEIWGHSHSHADTPTWYGKDWLTREIVTSKADLEAAMPLVKIQGWMQPGISHSLPKPYTCLDTPLRHGLDTTVFSDWYNSDGGRLIRQTYGLVEGDTHGTVRQLPTGPLIGAAHETTDTMSLAALQAVIDRAVNFKTGVEIMTHAGLVGGVGNISLSDWTAFLDYIVTQRDAGLIEVVTPSGLHFANPDTTRRAALVAQGDFTGFSTGAPGLWAGLTGITTGTDSGVGHVEVAAAGSMYQDYNALRSSLFDGEPFLVDCEVRRAVSGTAATAKVTLSEPAGTWTQTYTNAIPSGTGWTRWRIPFSTPLGASTARTLIGHSAGGAVQFRNVEVIKV